MHTQPPSPALSPQVMARLIAHHERFLTFLQQRVGGRDVAEEILQEAFVRGLTRGSALRDDESATAWFYRLLRNALTDHWRRNGAKVRALTRLADEPVEPEPEPDADLMAVACTCVAELLDGLKPAYAQVLRQVELEGRPVQEFAQDQRISANLASVRLRRAREALRREVVRCCGTCATHGCQDCSCQRGLAKAGRPGQPTS